MHFILPGGDQGSRPGSSKGRDAREGRVSFKKFLFFACFLVGVLVLLFCLSAGTARAGSWIQESSGGFGNSGNGTAYCSAVYGGRLYVGTGNSGGCEIWSWDGSGWAQVVGGGSASSITGPGFGSMDNHAVDCMLVFAGYLYAGTANSTGCRVFRYDGFEWEQVIGRGAAGTVTGPGFGVSGNGAATSMAIYGPHLYVGTLNSTTGCQIYRTDGVDWAAMAGGGAAEPAGFGSGANTTLTSMAAYGNWLFLGTHNISGCQVWRYDGSSWTAMIGGGGPIGPGFGNLANKEADCMVVFDSKLYVGTYNANGCQVWGFDGSGWSVLVGSGASMGGGFGTANNDFAACMAVYDSQLYVGTNNTAVGCQAWRFDGSSWGQVAGQDGAGTPGTGPGFGNAANSTAQTMAVFDSRLYFGTENGGGCEIWSNKSATTWYLAEGATAGGYETWILVQNPNDAPADITINFQTGTGEVEGPAERVPANSRRSYLANSYVSGFDVSTKVVSSAPDVICERAMYWTPPAGSARVLGHDSIGVIAPAARWYLAEGASKGGFETWVLVQNPNPAPVNIDIRFQTESGQKQGPLDTIPATSRKSYLVNSWVETFNVSSVVASLTPGEPIVCERSVYYTPSNSRNKEVGTDSIGVVEPASRWYLAEGATDGGFETWILVQNPNSYDVNVDLKYQTSKGEVQGPVETVFAGTRKSFRVNDKVKDFNVSTAVSSFGGDVVCERAVYWTPPGGNQKVLGHDSIGVRAGETSWYLAEGATEGGFETWVLIQNPNDSEVTIDLQFQTGSGPVPAPGSPPVRDTIPARSRRSYRVNGWVDSYDVSTRVTSISGAPIICERSVYWTPPGTSAKVLGTDSIGFDL
jgi:hypothetical protein